MTPTRPRTAAQQATEFRRLADICRFNARLYRNIGQGTDAETYFVRADEFERRARQVEMTAPADAMKGE